MSVWTNEEQAKLDALEKGSPERSAMLRDKLRQIQAKAEQEARLRNLSPEWLGAYTRLRELLPTAGFSSDGIIAAAEKSGTPFELRTVYNSSRTHKAGIGTKCWEDYDDDEVYELLFHEFPLTPGMLWFIPHDTFFPGNDRREPYLLDASELHDLVHDYPGKWNWGGQLNADTIFLWRDTPRITVIHHEGWLFNRVLPREEI